MTPEGKITAEIVRRLKVLEAEESLWWLKVHGGPMQRAGVPDLFVLHSGRPFFFEVKARGRAATRLQKSTMNKIRRVGGRAEVVYSWQDVQNELRR